MSVNGFASSVMDLDRDAAAATDTASAITFDPQSHSRSTSSVRDRPKSHSRSDSHGALSPGHRPKKSSSTCSTCRFRKVRCNGIHPVCSNCQRLGFPCSYDDSDADSWSLALPRRRVKQACLSCHSRKARCSGHMPACERCRAQGIECVYRPGKRTKGPGRTSYGEIRSPRSHDGDDRDRTRDRDHEKPEDSDTPLTDPANTPSTFNHDIPGMDESFDSLTCRTFDQFFRHVHHIPMYSFLHRASLMEQYNAGKVEKALLLALIGITSCLTEMGAGVREYGDHCIDRAEHLIFSDYSRPSTFKVQALVFMIKHRILSNRYPSAFMLLSMASRFAAALRLNHNSPNLCFLAQESRRRLMWSLYCIDAGISAGYRDFALWRADRILVSLPCNERNFEFDLPQAAEMLDPAANGPEMPPLEDVGSLALHIRILHLRQKIIEFTKDVLVSRTITDTPSLQEPVLALHKQLDDFASRLPSSFQFSESSLRLRAYSPRICVFVMIHVWWHQCHCDLYRMTMAGFREALPEAALQSLDPVFLAHCQRQCVDHSLAMASIFASMQKLGAKPVADLDLALCAYQCARMMKYALHGSGENLGLTVDVVTEKAKVCLQTIKQCCMGPAAGAIRSDLERLISQGLGSEVSSPQDTTVDSSRTNNVGSDVPSRHPVLRNIEVTEEPSVISTTQTAASRTGSHPPESFIATTPVTAATMQTSLSAQELTTPNTWTAGPTFPSLAAAMQAHGQPEPMDLANASNKSETGAGELNSAYEGALDMFDQDNGLAHAMGVEPNPWNWGGDLQWPDFLSSGVGV
ncbi:Transcription factor [Metarhizium rileyi]|uniref:Transcription factor n=1 Tax=Metarhizium rileyi (strain RCEF 4871) TaxID=1649241 RepID=A0A162JGD3_METRR|nr:Transcription factor [Metarhizium rileyi RCEF 4871]